MLSFIKEAHRKRGQAGHRKAIRLAPRRSHQSQGAVERWVQTCTGQTRTLRKAIEDKSGILIKAEDTLMQWIARHAAWCLQRYQAYHGGATPHPRARAYVYRGALCGLGETVLAKIPDDFVTGRQVGKLADRWRRGIWLGKTDESDEHLVSVQGQVERLRTVRRLLEGRWCASELKALRATPRLPKPGHEVEGDGGETGHPVGLPAPGGGGRRGQDAPEATGDGRR